MKSHFALNRGVTAACAVMGAATLLNGNSSAQSFVAADYATNSIYSGGWSTGQNGGHGFGAWSFNGTDASPYTNSVGQVYQYQAMSTASSLGTAWTLLTYSNSSGLANAGRSIPGGLEVGQTFQTTIQNPTVNPGIYTYRGFDILFTSASDNNVGGDNTAALRLQVFDYFNAAMNWHINDIGDYSPSPAVSGITTGASGMIIDFTLTSTNTYSLVMTPMNNPTSPYLNYSGTLGTNLPINYVNFRLYGGLSSGLTDTADNFEISSMTIAGVNLNIQIAGANAILSWPTNAAGFTNLQSTLNLGPAAVWNTVTPPPVVINGENVVTNPITGTEQFYRVKQ